VAAAKAAGLAANFSAQVASFAPTAHYFAEGVSGLVCEDAGLSWTSVRCCKFVLSGHAKVTAKMTSTANAATMANVNFLS
jgi:hypothetical protein